MQGRARHKISETVIEKYGGSFDRFPLLYTPFADNGNALEPNEVAERHYVCGDPRFVSAAWSVPGQVWGILLVESFAAVGERSSPQIQAPTMYSRIHCANLTKWYLFSPLPSAPALAASRQL